MKITPRPYQGVAVKAALKGLRGREKRALVVLATGLGKTFTAAFIAKEFRPKRTLFLVHNNFILKHAVDEFRLVFGKKVETATFNGMTKDGVASAEMVFATWQTMGGNLKLWKSNHFDLIIVDEAHHAEADTYRPVIDYFTGAKLGITATPDRGDDADIRDVFGQEVINITLEEAIARGWLPRIEYHVITDESLDEDSLREIVTGVREGKKRFTMAEVDRRIFIRKRDEEIARIIDGHKEKSVVFCSSIKHAEKMRRFLPLAATFHSSTAGYAKAAWKQNQKVLGALEKGTIRRVCAVNAFNEGVNVPSVGLVAFCRVTGSPTVFRQQLGRGLRPGKDKLVVLDFVGNLERVQLVLEMMNRISDIHERTTTREEREREGYKCERFEVSGKGFEFTFSDEVVDLLEVLEHCQREFYQTWQEASKATVALGIISFDKYQRHYKEDPRLPSCPNKSYPDFPGWPKFLGKERQNRFYSSWKEAATAAKERRITSYVEYQKKYRSDPYLPSDPHRIYPDFPGWGVFLGTGRTMRGGDNVYPTLAQASRAAKRLGVQTVLEYKTRYKEDPRLPSAPERKYKDFPGWPKFLGIEGRVFRKNAPMYSTWQQASKVARKLGIRSRTEYRRGAYKKDPKLHSNPKLKYPDFPGWATFLGLD